MKRMICVVVFAFASMCFCDTITGIVKTTDGKPVAGAAIQIFKSRYNEKNLVKTVISDRYGKFAIDGLETGYYRLVSSKKGFCDDNSGTIEVNQPKFGIASHEMILKKPGSISGFVYDPDGKPLQSAKLVATRNNKSTITDSRGFYKIDGLEPGTHYIYAEAKGFVKNHVSSVAVEENKETAGINFTLSYAGAIKGVVVDAETGKSVEGVSVECDSIQGYFSGKTDSNGRFFIDNLIPGKYNLSLYRQGYEYTNVSNITIVAQETTDAGQMKTKLRPKYFNLYSSEWLFTPGENVKLHFNAYRISSVTMNIYEIDLLNEINRTKNLPRSMKEMLMSVDISNQKPVLSKKIDISYKTPLTELSGRTIIAGTLPEGVYLCVITPENLPPQRQYFCVTDVGFISKTCDTKSIVNVFSISKGIVLADVFVYVFDHWWNLKQEIKTDSYGQFVLDTNQKFLVKSGKSFAFSDIVYQNYYGSDDRRVLYAYTDRPVYRPNHTVYFKAIPRIDAGDKYEMAHITSCQVKISAPDGSTLYETTLVPQKTGSIYGEWTIPDEPPLGTYSLNFTTQGKDILSGNCVFKVLEYRKPEFSIEVKTDKLIYLPGEKINALISAKYYFGTPVKNADVMWAVYSKPSYNDEFEDYEGEYEYESWWRGALISSGNVKTDENGIAVIEIPTKKSYQQKEGYSVEVKMTDLSRREITSSAKVLVVPGTFEISISTDKYVYSPDEEIPVSISARYYRDNSPVIGNRFSISASQETYDQKKRRWTFKELLNKKFVCEGEKATIKIKPSATGYIKIDVQGIDQFNNIISATRYVWIAGENYYSSWYGRKEIEIVSARKEYEVNDTAKILINSSYKDLNLLFSIEGTRLFETKLIRMQGNSALIEIPIKQEYIPNIYISVCGVKNKNFISSSKPLKIACKEKVLNVEIIPEKTQLEPGDNAYYRIKITDSEEKPVSAEFSMGVVDESIYAISGELVSKIEDFFYGSKRNRVSTFYSFNRWYYGGAGKDFSQQDIRRNFKDTAFWLPYAFTDSNGISDIQFNLPDNLTTWRTTIRAITSDTKVGSTINKIITKKPLIANLITPRFVVEDDRILISGVIHNQTGKNQKVSVELKAEGLDILDEKEKTVEIENGQSSRVDWKVKVNSVKNAVITLFARSSTYKDAMELTLPVFSYGADERYVFAGRCDDTRIDTFHMPAGTIPASIDAKSYIYPSLVSGLFTTLDELARYPYGCIEQTLSGFLPAVQVANTISRINKEDLDFLAGDKKRFDEMMKQLPKKVSDGLIKLYNYQNQDGGWGWWSGDSSSPYTSGYVMFGLAHAKKSGYLINEEKFELGKNFLKNAISSSQDYNQKVFMLYSLVYAGEKDASAVVEDIYKNRNKLHPYTLAQLCLILQNLGDWRAKDLLNELCSKLIKPSPNYCYWQGEDGHYSWIHHNIETTAWGLRAIIAIDPKRQEVPGILRYLVMKRQGGLWMSTKDTAMCLFAFTDYLEKSDELTPDYTLLLLINNNEVAKEHITRESIKKFSTTINIPPENIKAGKTNDIKIQKQGTGNLYYTHLIKYAVRDVVIPDFDSGFKVSRRYTALEPRKVQDASGNTVYVYDEITGPLKSGERFRVEIKISGEEKYEYAMIEDPIPAGCEVVQEIPGDNWWYCRKEIRDEKVAFFTTFWYDKERTISYQLRAETPGFYHVLPTKAQLMYLPEIWGRSGSNTLIIAP